MKAGPQKEPEVILKKVLGFSTLFAVAIGSVTAQSSFVSLLNGAANGGGAFFVALFIAFLLAICYIFTYLELSLMIPKAGSIGTYTTVSCGHFTAIIMMLGGYVAVTAFATTAELSLLEKVVNTIYPGIFPHLGLILIVLLTVLNLIGIDIFSSVQNIIVYVLVVSLFLIGINGLYNGDPKGAAPAEIWQQLANTNSSVFSLIPLAIWSFLGMEFVCPLIEEAKRPQKSLPLSMCLAAFVLLIVFVLFAFAGLHQLPAATLAGSEIPHWLLVYKLFGKTGGLVMVVFAITASSGFINIGLASLSRMLYGMAHHKQLPAIFKKLDSRWKTPWFGILTISFMIALPFILLSNVHGLIILMLISATVLYLIAYIIAHFNVMVLRRRYPNFKRPFKTPYYPLPQIFGILGMGYAIYDNSPSPDISFRVYTYTGIIVLVSGLYAFLWVRYKMKKGLFEAEPIGEAIED